jgi:hypothetical protein
VVGDFTSTGTPGAFVFIGVRGRANGQDGIEFVYEFALGKWALYTPTSGVYSAPMSWPGGTVKIRLLLQGGMATGYVNGSPVIGPTPVSQLAGNRRAGLILGNFTTGSVGKNTADNFVATGLP